MTPHADRDLDALMQGYLDGELDSTAEQQLFSRLSYDPAMLRELRDMRAIRSATAGSTRTFSPPDLLTSSLFSRLGMTAPAATSQLPIAVPAGNAVQGALEGGATSAASKFLAILSAYKIPLLLFSAGAVLTTSIFLWKDDARDTRQMARETSTAAGAARESAPADAGRLTDGKPSQDASTAKTVTEDASADKSRPDAGSAQDPAPVRHSSDLSARASGKMDLRAHAEPSAQPAGRQALDAQAAAEPRSSTVPVPKTAQPSPLPGSVTAQPSPLPGSQIDRGDIPAAAALPLFDPLPPQTGTPVVRRDATASFSRVRLPQGFLLTFNGFTKASAPVVDIASAGDPVFNRMSVSIGYALTPASHFGISFGQEAFPQRFDGTEDRRPVRYEQNLLTPWAAVWYRHTLPSLLFEELHPWLELSPGVTREVWPLLRGGAGLAFDVHPMLRVQVGVDVGVLGYRFQERWFTTRHVGAVYGLTMFF